VPGYSTYKLGVCHGGDLGSSLALRAAQRLSSRALPARLSQPLRPRKQVSATGTIRCRGPRPSGCVILDPVARRRPYRRHHRRDDKRRRTLGHRLAAGRSRGQQAIGSAARSAHGCGTTMTMVYSWTRWSIGGITRSTGAVDAAKVGAGAAAGLRVKVEACRRGIPDEPRHRRIGAPAAGQISALVRLPSNSLT
jgi:hypothetical protein